VPLAFLALIVLGGGASEVLHVALGLSFLLLAASVFDFALPPWIKLAPSPAIGVLGGTFLLQGIADIARSASIAGFAYGVLGQRLEKLLGYVFLAWCAAILFFDSRGTTRILGFLVFAIVLGVEIYSYAIALGGGARRRF